MKPLKQKGMSYSGQQKMNQSPVSIELGVFNNSSYSFFLTLFFTSVLSFLQATGVVSNLSMCNLSTLLFKLLKSFGMCFNLMSRGNKSAS